MNRVPSVSFPRKVEIKQVVIFDGECGMCSRLVRFSLSRLKSPETGFIASQSEAGQQLLKQLCKELSPSTIFLIREDGSIMDRSDAVLELLKGFRNPYAKLCGLTVFPKWFRDGFYRIIAIVRKWIPMYRVACEIDGSNQNLLLDQHDSKRPEWLIHLS